VAGGICNTTLGGLKLLAWESEKTKIKTGNGIGQITFIITRGESEVNLPSWFEQITRSIRRYS
jgi:hypothetical protein